jgi:hypothetical protein
MNNCQYFVTQYVAKHGPSPINVVRNSNRTRLSVLSHIHPMIKLAGDPTTKNASCNHPASFTSFSRSEKSNSSAAWDKFGESKFWSAYKNAEVVVIKNTEKYLCFLLVFLSSISSSISSSSAVPVSTNEEVICTGGFGGGFGDDDASIDVCFVVCFGGRRSALWMEFVRCSDTDDDDSDDDSDETRPAKEDEDEEARSWDMHHREDDKISETQRRSRS